jgi:hypothetical protein
VTPLAEGHTLFTESLSQWFSVERSVLVAFDTKSKSSLCYTMHEEEEKQNDTVLKTLNQNTNKNFRSIRLLHGSSAHSVSLLDFLSLSFLSFLLYIRNCTLSLNQSCTLPFYNCWHEVSLEQFLVLKMGRAEYIAVPTHTVSQLVIKCNAQTGQVMIFSELKQKLITGK